MDGNKGEEELYWDYYARKKRVGKPSESHSSRRIVQKLKKRNPDFEERYRQRKENEVREINVKLALRKEVDYSSLRKELIEIYEKYLNNPKDRDMMEKARVLHEIYSNLAPVVDKPMAHAIHLLVDIGYDLPTPKKPSKEVVERLLKDLRNSKS